MRNISPRLKIIFYSTLSVLIAAIFFVAQRDEVALAQLNVYEWWAKITPPPPASSTELIAEPEKKIRELMHQLAQKDAEIYGLERALKEFENFRNYFPQIKVIVARVIGSSLTQAEVVIDVGEDDGVNNGWAAAQGQVLAGVVGLAGKNSSYVLLAENTGCLLPARAEKSRDICSVRGLGNGRALAVFYANQTETSPGEKLLTSGLIGKIPDGLLIGTIDDYPLRGAQAGTLEAPVKLEADFAALEYLLLLKKE